MHSRLSNYSSEFLFNIFEFSVLHDSYLIPCDLSFHLFRVLSSIQFSLLPLKNKNKNKKTPIISICNIYNVNKVFPSARLFWTIKKQPPEVIIEKAVLKNFTKLTRKHLRQSPFFCKVASTSGGCFFSYFFWTGVSEVL